MEILGASKAHRESRGPSSYGKLEVERRVIKIQVTQRERYLWIAGVFRIPSFILHLSFSFLWLLSYARGILVQA